MKSNALLGKSREGGCRPKLILLVSIAIVAFSFAGCGKKGPPVHPDLNPLPKISSLRAEVSVDQLRLAWDAPVGGSFVEPDGYKVYRAVKSLSDECPNCPDNFREVAFVSARSRFLGTRPKILTYGESLEKGYLYRYKIEASKDSDSPGVFSNTVEVTY